MFLRLGGGSQSGELIELSELWSPGTASQKKGAAHGPPPPLLFTQPRSFLPLLRFSCLVLGMSRIKISGFFSWLGMEMILRSRVSPLKLWPRIRFWCRFLSLFSSFFPWGVGGIDADDLFLLGRSAGDEFVCWLSFCCSTFFCFRCWGYKKLLRLPGGPGVFIAPLCESWRQPRSQDPYVRPASATSRLLLVFFGNFLFRPSGWVFFWLSVFLAYWLLLSGYGCWRVLLHAIPRCFVSCVFFGFPASGVFFPCLLSCILHLFLLG